MESFDKDILKSKIRKELNDVLEDFKYRTNTPANRYELKCCVEEILDSYIYATSDDEWNTTVDVVMNPDDHTEVTIRPEDEATEELLHEIYDE